jgi:hypothetical protein
MSEQPSENANLFAQFEPGTETGEYISDDGRPRVWDGEKWLSPKDALEAGIIDKAGVMEELADADLGDLKKYSGTECLWKIPGFFVLDLADSDYANGREKLEFFDDLDKAKAEFWEAIKEAVVSGNVNLEDIGRLVHYRSVYVEGPYGDDWETAEVYDCPGFAVIDYGSFTDTCSVPRFEIHDDVDSAKNELESFVDGLEMDAQGNIEYEWQASVWNEGEQEVTYGASWQEEEEEEEEEDDDDEQNDEDDAEGSDESTTDVK